MVAGDQRGAAQRLINRGAGLHGSVPTVKTSTDGATEVLLLTDA